MTNDMIPSEAVTAGAIRQSLASGEAIADVTQIRGLVRERNELARQLAEVQAQRDTLQEAWNEMRDAVLNERGALAEMGLDSDQVNAVLDVIDDAWPDDSTLADAPANPYAAVVEAARRLVELDPVSKGAPVRFFEAFDALESALADLVREEV